MSSHDSYSFFNTSNLVTDSISSSMGKQSEDYPLHIKMGAISTSILPLADLKWNEHENDICLSGRLILDYI